METVLSFVLSRKIINIYNDIAQKYGNVTVKDLSLIFTCLLIKWHIPAPVAFLTIDRISILVNNNY